MNFSKSFQKSSIFQKQCLRNSQQNCWKLKQTTEKNSDIFPEKLLKELSMKFSKKIPKFVSHELPKIFTKDFCTFLLHKVFEEITKGIFKEIGDGIPSENMPKKLLRDCLTIFKEICKEISKSFAEWITIDTTEYNFMGIAGWIAGWIPEK